MARRLIEACATPGLSLPCSLLGKFPIRLRPGMCYTIDQSIYSYPFLGIHRWNKVAALHWPYTARCAAFFRFDQPLAFALGIERSVRCVYSL
jgi:hypothetical protein